MCDHPWQEELSPGQSDSDEEKDGEDKVVKREKKEEGEEEGGYFKVDLILNAPI